MPTQFFTRLFCTLAVTVVMAVPLQASAQNLVANGSFESPNVNGNQLQVVPPGWSTIAPVGVDVIRAGYFGSIAADGLQFADLIAGPGTFPAGIFQNLSLVAGVTYSVSFAYNGGLYDGGAATNGSVLNFSFGSLASQAINVDALNVYAQIGTATPWQSWTNQVTPAVSGVYRLEFRTNTGFFAGPYVDNVSVSVVPEPTSTLLLLLGVPLAVWSARLRTSSAGAA